MKAIEFLGVIRNRATKVDYARSNLQADLDVLHTLMEFEAPDLAPILAPGGVNYVDEWIKWTGGVRPVACNVKVEVRLRDGTTYIDVAEAFQRGWLSTFGRHGDEIVAYRLVKGERP